MIEDIAIDNGVEPLAGQLVRPKGEPKIAVVIHAATGVRGRYYQKFAQWLATEHQAAVLTYDYGQKGAVDDPPGIKGSTVTMADWGLRDQSAALDALAACFPDIPLWVIGHSLGALFVPWHARAGQVQRVIAVASGPAYVTRHPLAFLPLVFYFWYLSGPLLTKLCGYLPSRCAGIGGDDLPAGVFWQWRRWCTSRLFNQVDWGGVIPKPDFTRVTAQVDLVSIADDPMIPPSSVAKLAAYYPAAQRTERLIQPAACGLKQIGHLRVFSERCAAAWPQIIG